MVELGRKFIIFNRYIMKISKEFWIILGFALLHAAVALGCRLAGLADEMMLTLLTMPAHVRSFRIFSSLTSVTT